ncbi:MAG TPA: sulfotransferase [Actinoplanes sp.]|nr:sulfotransferase [Actinoplanes sp.]
MLYLAGTGRSGSTLVTTALGQMDGFFAAGELRYLWQRGLADNRPCGCGTPFRQCPMWTRVLADVPVPGGLAARLRSRLRMRHRLRVPPHPDDDAIAALYRSIAAHTGGAVIVDSSKLPPYGVLLSRLPGVELRVLHVVRDPRAAAFSWRRRRALDAAADGRLMTRHPVWKAALLWSVWNAATLRLWGRGAYLRIRYEDLVADPARVLRAVATFAGAAPDAPLPVTADGSVALAPTHSVAGNPMRHRTGGVPVRADEEWRHAMPRRSRLVVTALTGPLLGRLGYPLRPGRVAGPAPGEAR